MGTEFRYRIAGQDLIMEEGKGVGPFKSWSFYRNLDEESRIAWENYEVLKAQAENARQIAIVVSTNVRQDRELLQMHLCHDSDYVMTVPAETSILETRDGVKYNMKGGNSGKGGGGNNNQNQNQNQNKGNGDQQQQQQQQQQQKKQKGGTHRQVSLLSLLMDAKITVPSNQTQH